MTALDLRGRRALEVYHKALKEGKTPLRRIPLMFIGQDRSGKTSLNNSLKGMPFNLHEDSTVGINVDPSFLKVTTGIWKTEGKDQASNKGAKISFEYNLGRPVVESLSHDENLPMTDTEEQSEREGNEGSKDLTEISTRICGQDDCSV